MKRCIALFLVFTMALSLTGCSQVSANDLMKDVPAQAVDVLPDMDAGSAAAADFGVRLFQTSMEEMNTGDTTGRLPDIKNFEQDLLLAMEKEMLGVYITGHPLNDYADRIRELTTVTSEDLASAAEPEHNADHHIQDGMTVIMAGMITGQKKLVTKNNKMMSFVDLEDLYGTVEVVVFPNVYDKFMHTLTEDNVVVIKGKLNFKEEV